MTEPSSFAEVISLWPSTVEMARDLSVKEVTVRAWRARGIPGSYWLPIAQKAAERGIANVTVERLAFLGSPARHAAAE